MGRKGSVTTHMKASPEAVYALVSDITRMGEWSPETVRCVWLDGATGPEVGARFKGSNKDRLLRWSTKPFVDVAEPGREFTFTTGSPNKPITRWSYKLTPSGDGTDVEESWEELGQLPVIGRFMMSDKREHRLNQGMATTLERIKSVVESSA